MAQQPAGFVPDGFEPDAPVATAEPSSPLARAGSAFLETVNPVNAVKNLYQQVRHPIDSANARLQYEEAHPFEAAMGKSPLGQYGGTRAGSRIGQGDIAGGLGEGAGDVFNAATPVILPKVPALARGAVGAVPKVATVAANVIEHPVVAPVLGAAAGYAHSGPIGALGGLVGEEVFKPHLVRVLRKIGAMGKTPALPDILDEVTAAKTEPVEPFKPVLTSGEPPAAGAVTPKQLNEARLAEIRAAYKAKQAPAAAPAPAAAVTPAAAAEPSSELATRMQTIRNTPSAGSETHYPGNAGMPQGPNMHDVAARTVDAYQMPSRATEARAQWNPPPASPEQAAAAATALEPVPLSKAVTAVRQAATVAKQKLTATEFTEATRLAKAGHPADSVLEAIQVQRALKGQSSFAGLPTDAEMRADMGNRARSGQKSLMGAYGDEPAVAGNPYR